MPEHDLHSKVRQELLWLAEDPIEQKTWRPHILVFTGNPHTRASMLRWACLLEGGTGTVTAVEFVNGFPEAARKIRHEELPKLKAMISENRLPVFPEVVVGSNFESEIPILLQAHSLGAMKPNTVIFGWPKDGDKTAGFVRNIGTVSLLGMNCVLYMSGIHRDDGYQAGNHVDLWWRGQKNGALMLKFAKLLCSNRGWEGKGIRILRLVNSDHEKMQTEKDLTAMLAELDVKAEIRIIISGEPFRKIFKSESEDADSVFLGFIPPESDRVVNFYYTIRRNLDRMPPAFLFHSSGE